MVYIPVGGTDDDDSGSLGGARAIQLHHELRLLLNIMQKTRHDDDVEINLEKTHHWWWSDTSLSTSKRTITNKRHASKVDKHND